MNQPAASQERRRQELTLAAFNQIAERGFEGLRTREVAADVGLNIATLHYYFPTKEALIRGVVEYAMSRFRTTLTPHGSPVDQLRNHLHAVRKLLLEEPQVATVMGEIALRSSRDESIAAILDDTYAGWHATTRGLLRRAARNGQLPPEADSDGAAAVVVATLSSMTLPTMSGSPHMDQALQQLERWLGLTRNKKKTPKSSK